MISYKFDLLYFTQSSLSKMGRENKEEADSKKKAFKPIVIEDPRNYK